jgi:hypothetical protein
MNTLGAESMDTSDSNCYFLHLKSRMTQIEKQAMMLSHRKLSSLQG